MKNQILQNLISLKPDLNDQCSEPTSHDMAVEKGQGTRQSLMPLSTGSVIDSIADVKDKPPIIPMETSQIDHFHIPTCLKRQNRK